MRFALGLVDRLNDFVQLRLLLLKNGRALLGEILHTGAGFYGKLFGFRAVFSSAIFHFLGNGQGGFVRFIAQFDRALLDVNTRFFPALRSQQQ